MGAYSFFADIKKQDDKSRLIADALKALKGSEVLVGIPQENFSRNGDGSITNAELLYIHTNGSPVNNIPARPVIEPAIEDSRKQISEPLKEAGKKALAGDQTGALRELDQAGMIAENAAKAWFDSQKNGWQENSNVTIYGSAPDKDGNKFIKGKGERKNQPLIDTGQMRKAITHVVRREG